MKNLCEKEQEDLLTKFTYFSVANYPRVAY